jgi:hypothetical protein
MPAVKIYLRLAGVLLIGSLVTASASPVPLAPQPARHGTRRFADVSLEHWWIPRSGASLHPGITIGVEIGTFSETVVIDATGDPERHSRRFGLRSSVSSIRRVSAELATDGWLVSARVHGLDAAALSLPVRIACSVDAAMTSAVIRPRALSRRRFLIDPNLDDDRDGMTVRDGDCDDARADVHPGAREVAGDGVDEDCSGSDLTGLVEISPPDGARNVGVQQSTVLRFSAPLDPSTVDPGCVAATSDGIPLEHRLDIAPDGRSIVVAYAALLPPRRSVEVVVDGSRLRDADGGPIDVDGNGAGGGPGVISFETGDSLPETDGVLQCDLTGSWYGGAGGYSFTATLTQGTDGTLTGTVDISSVGTFPLDGQVVGNCIQATIRSTPYGDATGHGGVTEDCNSFYFQFEGGLLSAFTVYRA